MEHFAKTKLALLLALFLVLPAQGEPAETMPDALSSIARSIVVGGHTAEYDRALSDKFGGRLSGSPAYESAATWSADTFRSLGLKNVHLETFDMPHGWERGPAHGRIVAPLTRPLHVESLGWSPSTPTQGIKGQIAPLSSVDSDYIRSQTDKLNGKIALLVAKPAFGEDWTAFYRRQIEAYSIIQHAGAVAILQPDQEYNQVLNADSATWGGTLASLPIAQIGMEDAALIKRLCDKGAVQVEYEYQNRVRDAMKVSNVVAELPGREKGNEWILVGAHLDSWDYATGSQDNGTGVAMVLEVARALTALGKPPLRSVRFLLWGGEEQGLLGSTAWVRAHRADLENIVAYLNTDNGGGHPQGWKVEGRKDMETAIQPISRMLADLDGDQVSQEVTFDTDHGPFMLEGIPVLDLWVDMSHYMTIHHKVSDTFDKIDNLNLNAGSAIVAVTTYALADRPDAIGKHIDHAAVADIVKRAHFDTKFLRDLGWDF